MRLLVKSEISIASFVKRTCAMRRVALCPLTVTLPLYRIGSRLLCIPLTCQSLNMGNAVCDRELRASRLCDCLLAAVVCKQCHYAVPADMLRTHLSAKDGHSFKLQLVRDIIEEVRRC